MPSLHLQCAYTGGTCTSSPSPVTFISLMFFQHDNSAKLTYRNVLKEMSLCFDLPMVKAEDSYCFCLCRPSQFVLSSSYLWFILCSRWRSWQSPANSFVSSVTRSGRTLLSYAFIFISTNPVVTCLLRQRSNLTSTVIGVSLLIHTLIIFLAGCAEHILHPIRRRDAPYLPPKKPSPDPRFARLPLLMTMRARGGSQSPSKRSASGSVSPQKDIVPNDNTNEEDVVSPVAPPEMVIGDSFTRQTTATFRSSCLVAARRCAVTSKGRSWCSTPAIGPALQACHIVPSNITTYIQTLTILSISRTQT